jgi:ADP-heptose:LPS heptosyltransferase
VVFMQGPGDEPFVEQAVKSMTTRPLGIASGLTLRAFAALMKECTLVVVHDTGPMHIAAAQNVPVMAIIGPSHPAYTPPRGEFDRVIWAGASCSPCLGSEDFRFTSRWHGKKVFKCWRSTHECMVAIKAEDVCDAVIQQIEMIQNALRIEGFPNSPEGRHRNESSPVH